MIVMLAQLVRTEAPCAVRALVTACPASVPRFTRGLFPAPFARNLFGCHMCIIPHECHHVKPLRYLSELKLVFVSIPKATATGILAVMADTKRLEASVAVRNCFFEFCQIQRRVRPIDTGGALITLYSEGH